jgi:hypothetical protein
MPKGDLKKAARPMAGSSPSAAALLDLPLELLTCVCLQLDFRDLIRVAETCKRFRHGDGGLETVELDLPLEVMTCACEQLNLHDTIRVAETCTRSCLGDGDFEAVELPTKSPVVTALCEVGLPWRRGIPSTRPIGCSESWVAFLARKARQCRCREAHPIVAGFQCSLFVDAAGRLLACGKGAAVGHGDENVKYPRPTTVPTVAGVRVRSVAAGIVGRQR